VEKLVLLAKWRICSPEHCVHSAVSWRDIELRMQCKCIIHFEFREYYGDYSHSMFRSKVSEMFSDCLGIKHRQVVKSSGSNGKVGVFL
jgi:hypothetical protein